MNEPTSRASTWIVAGVLLAVVVVLAGAGWWLTRGQTNAPSSREPADVAGAGASDDEDGRDDESGDDDVTRGSAGSRGRGRSRGGSVDGVGRARGPRDASAGTSTRDEDGGAASFARRRAGFVLAVNEMLAAMPDERRFEGREPDIAWQRGFGHTLRVNNALARVCLMQSPIRDGDRGGMLAYELAVDASGRVTDAAITQDPIGDPAFAECLLGALRGMSFPASSGPVSMQAGVLVGGRGYRGARPVRAASHPDDGLVFVHALRGLGPMPE
ncbi:MAG: hypothetical protein IT379_36610 [Deltaproteobacteria bacterium]|nr:hypothetical protein [Deltaproteobacteria bacterium]